MAADWLIFLQILVSMRWIWCSNSHEKK